MKDGSIKLGGFEIPKGMNFWKKKVINSKKDTSSNYLAPEIFKNTPYDSKVDIWALGVLLYELMTFKMPFNTENLPLFCIKINRGIYSPPPGIYSSEIKELLKKCLTVSPGKRPTIDEILKFPIIRDRINKFVKKEDNKNDTLKE
jgi:NIMA (never in mitosis gene a)-related kinase